MSMQKAERQQIENEMIFRRMNEKIGDDLQALDTLHINDNNPHLISEEDFQLRFKCECSDENCDVRIPLKLSEYAQLHTNRDTFIIKPDHQVEAIETVVKQEPSYSVVKKNNSTPEPSNTLNDTTIDNS